MKTSKLVLIFFALIFSAIANAAVTINQYIGAWSATPTYAAGNIVTYNNQTYLALAAVAKNKIPNLNPASWQLLGSNVTGPQGPQGLQGPAGATGPAGPQGLQGIAGAAGKNGTNGTNGTNGAPGAQGPQGVAGPIGPQGPAGAAAKAGDACTIAGSNIVNTGILSNYSLSNGPNAGVTNYLVCQDPNLWDFLTDAKIGMSSSFQFRNWSLMETGALPGSTDPEPISGLNPFLLINPANFTFTNSLSTCLMHGAYRMAGPPYNYTQLSTPCWKGQTGLGYAITGAGKVYNDGIDKVEYIIPSSQTISAAFTFPPSSAVIAWQSPFNGSVSISSIRALIDINNTNVMGIVNSSPDARLAVFKNNQIIINSVDSLLANSFPSTVNVAIGDVLYFVFGQDFYDSTYSLNISIRRIN